MVNEKLEEKTRRISERFSNELESIKGERRKLLKLDKVSDQMITFLIPKHVLWKRIRDELITIPNLAEYVNKKLIEEKKKLIEEKKNHE